MELHYARLGRWRCRGLCVGEDAGLGGLQDEANILKSLSATQFRRVREIVVDCILATDMQGHMALLHDWAALLDKLPVRSCPTDDWAPWSVACTKLNC